MYVEYILYIVQYRSINMIYMHQAESLPPILQAHSLACLWRVRSSWTLPSMSPQLPMAMEEYTWVCIRAGQ